MPPMNGSGNQKCKLDQLQSTLVNVAGRLRRGRPRKTWSDLVAEDMRLRCHGAHNVEKGPTITLL